MCSISEEIEYHLGIGKPEKTTKSKQRNKQTKRS